MKIPDSNQLYNAVLNKKPLKTDYTEIDHSKLFIPERLTQLYHTSAYTLLNPQQKLRYNQLFAVRAIEQLMTLEARFIALVLARTSKLAHFKYNSELIYCMQEMENEEVQHYQMFLTLNKLAEPVLYKHNDMVFAKLSHLERGILQLLAKTPGISLFLLWILLILEEFSTCISKQMTNKNDDTGIRLEPNFIQAHREHLKDESRHVAICARLLKKLIKNSNATTIKINQFILSKFMADYMTPKRGGIRVINKLIDEFPELKKHQNSIIKAIKSQKQDKIIFEALQDPKLMPFSHKLFQQYPEFYFVSPVHS